jgi:hypothetical protein
MICQDIVFFRGWFYWVLLISDGDSEEQEAWKHTAGLMKLQQK